MDSGCVAAAGWATSITDGGSAASINIPGEGRLVKLDVSGRAGRTALLAAALLAGAAGPAPPGAESCTVCHVKGGGIGLLQGRPAQDTVRIMEAYRDGRTPATLMRRIVRGFTPDEVTQLALWFAGQ